MIIPSGEEQISIVDCLKELDCCTRCILRYLGMKTAETYVEPEHYLNGLYEDKKQITCSDPLSKKSKRNPCRICLDIFQDSTLQKFADSLISTNINEYNYPDFVTAVSFPKSIIIRNYSMFFYLKEKFPNIYNNLSDLENLNKIFRLSSSEIISQKINKAFRSRSSLVLNFEIGYEDDELEVKNIKNINYLVKRSNQQDTSRNVITEMMSKCEEKLFREQFSVPPDIPTKEITSSVHYVAEPMWIGGRYLKFSRDMGQTPFIINDKFITEHSVQDILFEGIEKILGCDKTKLTFCASGREDSDVRMLGNGRPFYIQIDDPKNRSVTFEMYRAIEKKVFKSKLAAVVKLQEIFKNDMTRIKDGEQNKRKHYFALCKTSANDLNYVANIINHYNGQGLEIHQKTPLRVLHRRTQAIREKYIYSMEAKIVPGYPDLIEIKLVAQAGTYIKEFINGDFERTQPSLSSIIQHQIDVVALDVTKIELIWPEEDDKTK